MSAYKKEVKGSLSNIMLSFLMIYAALSDFMDLSKTTAPSLLRKNKMTSSDGQPYLHSH
ncbi:hypothetical protein [Candidatus Nitrosocosmicus oleophilus]|uniref:hypothetical protein n=1 Tax=Candidatus Nitrosocosmicus oleophilus TaxID=1353260 RepID=UPI001E4DD24A|nr:hypothetical protein [Candidatus Nitrosocosmicus oleophilus]